MDGLEDCEFCYCPFYPCEDESRGGYWKDTPKGRIWACERCTYVHRIEVVEQIKTSAETRRLRCAECGKEVSTDLPFCTVVEAWIECINCCTKKAEAAG